MHHIVPPEVGLSASVYKPTIHLSMPERGRGWGGGVGVGRGGITIRVDSVPVLSISNGTRA